MLTFLNGGGENGKTTIVDAVRESVGCDYVVTLPDRVLLANTGDHPTELMTLRGARLAFMEELPDQHLNIKRLKDTHGTGRMSARYCGQDSVEWSPTHSVFVTTNHLPRIDEPEHAVWRGWPWWCSRCRYRKAHEPIEGPIDRRGDAGLRERLRSPRSKRQHEAVLAWLVAGAVKWYQNGMPEPPAEVEAAKTAWRVQVDVILKYACDNLVPADPNHPVNNPAVDHIWTPELYGDFAEWLKASGQSAWAEQTFQARFEQHPCITKKNIAKKRFQRYGKQWKGLARRPLFFTSYGTNTTISPLPEKYSAWLGVRFRVPGDTFDPYGKNGW